MNEFENKIICGDCVNVMPDFPDGCIDLTVTSPPYDDLRTYNGYEFDFEAIAQELYRVTKDGGVVVWVVGDATIKGSETGTSFRQALHFKDIGFNLHDTMIYHKYFYVPLTHNRYEQCWEYMFIFVKGQLLTFNPIMLNCHLAGEKHGRGKWDDHRREFGDNRPEGMSNNARYKDEKIHPNLFIYKPSSLGEHSASFPDQLAIDHILSWSNVGDLVLDPMCGSGTTCKAAVKLGRRYIGIDTSKEYCGITKERIKIELAQPDLPIF